MHAVRLRQVDLDYRNHLQAFLNFSVQAKKPAGKGKSKPVYTRFRKFYDYEREIEKATTEKKSRLAGLGKFLTKGGE